MNTNSFVIPSQFFQKPALKTEKGYYLIDNLLKWIKDRWVNKKDSFLLTKQRKRLIIGIHGWYPNKFLQKIIGEPEGTSFRLAHSMNKHLNGEIIAHEFEGKIMDRVNSHFKYLTNTYKNFLDFSEFIIISHSQGSPVSVFLLEQLLQNRLINPLTQNIYIVSLAGILQGPLKALKNNLVVKYLEADAARELFELSDPNSQLSNNLTRAISYILNSGTYFILFASWLDQVVPLYSSLLLPFSCKNIYRAIFFDPLSKDHSMLAPLCDLALDLSNRQNLEGNIFLAHISPFLTGDLFKCNSHSSIYKDEVIYKTTKSIIDQYVSYGNKLFPDISIDQTMLHHKTYSNNAFIPWALRSLLSSNLNEEFNFHVDYKKIYDDWSPSTKTMIELKQFFEPLRCYYKN